jgi:hypothetical protein
VVWGKVWGVGCGFVLTSRRARCRLCLMLRKKQTVLGSSLPAGFRVLWENASWELAGP